MIFSLLIFQVGRCNLNDDNSDPNIRSLPCSQKYLMKSYFEKHGSLLDSDFQDFLAHEFPLGSCKALPNNLNPMVRLSVLQRHLIGQGSHRRLFSSMKFDIQLEAISELPAHFCEVVIIEKLPLGVFADPFELQHLVQRGVFADAVVFGDTNLEVPSALSNRTVVEVHMDIGCNVLSRHEKGLEINIDLPLHSRYPPLEGNGYSRVEIGAADLFTCCRIEEKSPQRNCLWMSIVQGSESKIGAVVWMIPSGIKAHAGAVSAVTFISALLSTLLIVLSSIYSPNFNNFGNSKKS
ncbi:hypothetical protein HHK36_028468 [Tetracentron sinense]|uniref:Phosphatidylinositol-glycan biosynthesis class X protein n=1 Tax=Tetracentron sinense TaxID=13715 RepID=A0A834YBE8_TETSI|nr:hypothetical protein HHK36_028468 [Tetracentron sinense]